MLHLSCLYGNEENKTRGISNAHLLFLTPFFFCIAIMEEDQVDVCASQRSHFEHKDEFLNYVETIVNTSELKEATEALQQLAVIVTKIQTVFCIVIDFIVA